MEFACRGRPAADQDDGDDSRRRHFPDAPPPHDAGDAMLVIRDALLLQLQKDRLRQQIIMAELARLENAMALSSPARHGIDSDYMEQQPKPLFFSSSEEFMPHHRWMEHYSDVNEVQDPKKKDVKHGTVQSKSLNPVAEDRFSVCLRPCCSNGKAEENEAFDEQKLQESNEPTKMSPLLKWELTGITIPVKKPKQSQRWSCAICQVETPDIEHIIKVHCAGKRHRSNIASLESRNKTISQKVETTAESSSCAGQKTSSISWSCGTCQANGKAEENESFDEQKLQESNEPTKMSPSLKWKLTGITIPVKKPKQLGSWSCAICQVKTPDTEQNIKEHCAGKKHQSNVASLQSRNKIISQKAETMTESASCAGQKTSSVTWSCSTCQTNGTSEADLKEHLSGKTHQQNIEGQCQEGDGMAKNAEPQEAKCQESKLPQISGTSEADLKEHLSGKTHQQNIEGQCQEGDGMAKNVEPQEAKCQESKLPQISEKTPCIISQDNCTTESELVSLLLAKIQALLGAMDNMPMNSESHEARLPPNNMPQDAEQTSQSHCSVCQTGSTSQSNCSICQTGSGYQSCCSEPQSENPCETRKCQKKIEALQVEGQDDEPDDMKSGDKISSDVSCSKSASSEEKQASYLCEVCNLDLKSESRLADHCNGVEHLEKQKLLNFCEVCNLQCSSRKMLDHHRTGKKHKKNLSANK